MDSEAFQDIIQYAPWILVAFLFFKQNRMFVTPEMMQQELQRLYEKIERDFVRKEVHDLAIGEFKNDLADMKEKIDKIYDKLYGID